MPACKSYLAQDYTPSSSDVICGRGIESFRHVGNVAYRQIINDNLQRYNCATSKLQKSIIVMDIVEAIMNKSGKFVRFDHKAQCWFELAKDAAARQKVGTTIRDMQREPRKKRAAIKEETESDKAEGKDEKQQ